MHVGINIGDFVMKSLETKNPSLSLRNNSSFIKTNHYVATHKTIHMYYLTKSHDLLNKSYD